MRKAHIIGIAGVGMSATALLLKEAGWVVTGSDDAAVYGPPVEVLKAAGISFARGYSPKNIPSDTECFVVGRNAKLDPAINEEVRAAHERGKPVYSFPEILGEVTKNRENTVIAGSYGKSTTTSLIAHIFQHAGVDVGYFIGAEPVKSERLPAPAKIGSAPLFILEGDEYPSGHADPRAKFLHFHPRDILLTSIVHDHVNVYPTFESYKKPFEELLALLPKGGLVVVSADEPQAHALARTVNCHHVSYGLAGGHYQARDIAYGTITRFTLYAAETPLGEFQTSLIGAHNVENITGAAAYVIEKNLATFAQVAAAVKDFKGVHRKLYDLTPEARVSVYEGFGSSYEKARSAIAAMRLHFPNKPLIVVFEPHTFGWRNRANLAWYDNVFEGASTVFIAPPETQGAGTHDQLSHDEILAHVGTIARPYALPKDVVAALTGNEIVLILTSGDLHGTLEALTKEVGDTFS